MAYLVTGGCGFVGSNLTAELIRRRKHVLVVDNFTRPGTPANLAWLRELGELSSSMQIHAMAMNWSRSFANMISSAFSTSRGRWR